MLKTAARETNNFPDRRFYYENYFLRFIIGDPGAASRDGAVFLGESLFQAQKSPWELTLYRTSSRNVRIHPADWPEKSFSGQSARRSRRGNSIASLHDMAFFFDWRVPPKWRVSETKPRKSQIEASHQIEAMCASTTKIASRP